MMGERCVALTAFDPDGGEAKIALVWKVLEAVGAVCGEADADHHNAGVGDGGGDGDGRGLRARRGSSAGGCPRLTLIFDPAAFGVDLEAAKQTLPAPFPSPDSAPRLSSSRFHHTATHHTHLLTTPSLRAYYAHTPMSYNRDGGPSPVLIGGLIGGMLLTGACVVTVQLTEPTPH
jgi:hypothetical protein